MEVVEKQDVEDLKKSLDIAMQFFSVHIPNIVGEEIGAFLLEQTHLLIRQNAADESHFYFTAAEIYKSMNGQEDSEKARRWMKGHENNLSKLFDQTSSLNALLAEKSLSPLTLERVSSKGGTPTKWRVRTGAIKSTNAGDVNTHRVRYVVTRIDDALPWAKPFSSLILTPRMLVITAVGLLVSIALTIYTFIGLVEWGSKSMNTCVVIVGMFACIVFVTLHELLNKGITTYPALWSKKLAKNKLLTINPTGQSEAPIFMKAVTIEAKCSICGEDLLIEKSREFHNRFVGKCRVAPSEHVFSFDHITKEGKFLR
ncbi:MAG: hypothetical protein VX078_22570 [Pseudomonadota bacterium]|nr:hypothetical protein [Pseudomonadota bacterium]